MATSRKSRKAGGFYRLQAGDVVTVHEPEEVYGSPFARWLQEEHGYPARLFLEPGETATIIHVKTPSVTGRRSAYFHYCEFEKGGRRQSVALFPDNWTLIRRTE